jgi:hypothetical protein
MCKRWCVDSSCSDGHLRNGESYYRDEHIELCENAVKNKKVCKVDDYTVWKSDDQVGFSTPDLEEVREAECWDCREEEIAAVYLGVRYDSVSSCFEKIL